MSFLNRFLTGRPQDDTLRSVVRNLTHLFNSKRGYGSPLCEFGLAGYFSQVGTRATAEAVMRELFADVSRYEPRLRPLQIRALNDGELPLAFELRGELRTEPGRGDPPGHAAARPCRLGILFDAVHGEVAVAILDDAPPSDREHADVR